MSHAGPARRWSGLAVLAGLAGVFWSQVRWARVSNFGGYDEWLILWLTSRGIVSFPYARRPLELVWALPAPLLFPHRWLGFRLLHAAYLFLGALLFYRLCRRLIPRHLPIAFLAAAFSLTWAPSDPVRLQLVESMGRVTLEAREKPSATSSRDDVGPSVRRNSSARSRSAAYGLSSGPNGSPRRCSPRS